VEITRRAVEFVEGVRTVQGNPLQALFTAALLLASAKGATEMLVAYQGVYLPDGVMRETPFLGPGEGEDLMLTPGMVHGVFAVYVSETEARAAVREMHVEDDGTVVLEEPRSVPVREGEGLVEGIRHFISTQALLESLWGARSAGFIPEDAGTEALAELHATMLMKAGCKVVAVGA